MLKSIGLQLGFRTDPKKAQAFAIRLTVHHKPQLYMGKPAPV